MGRLEVKWDWLALDKFAGRKDPGTRGRDDGFRQIFQGGGGEDRNSRLEKPARLLRRMEGGR